MSERICYVHGSVSFALSLMICIILLWFHMRSTRSTVARLKFVVLVSDFSPLSKLDGV